MILPSAGFNVITPADLIASRGRIRPDFFPALKTAGSLEAYVQGYIDDAVSRGAPDDNAIRAWAYHRVFQELADDKARRAAEMEAGVYTEKHTKEQIAYFSGESAKYLAQWESIVNPPPPPASSTNTFRSGSVRTRTSW